MEKRKAQVDKFPATLGLRFGGRGGGEDEGTSRQVSPQPRIFSSKGGGRGRRRHSRQVSRNLGSLVWGKAQSTSFPQPRVLSWGEGAEKRKTQSTSFPQLGSLVCGEGGEKEQGAVDKFPATSGLRSGEGVHGRRRHSRQVSRNLGSLVWAAGGWGRRRHSRQVSRNLGSLVWGERGARRRGRHRSTSFPQPRVFSLGGGGVKTRKAQVNKFPATSGLKFGGRKKEAQSTSFLQPRVFSWEGEGGREEEGTVDKFPATSGL